MSSGVNTVFVIVRNDVLSGGQECQRLRSNLSSILKHIDVTESHPRVVLVGRVVAGFDDTESW